MQEDICSNRDMNHQISWTTRVVRLKQQQANSKLGFSLRGGKEAGGLSVGVFVSHVELRGEAERKGLKVGDQLIEVNGFEVNGATYDKVISLIRATPKRDDILLVVQNVGRIPVQEKFGEPVIWVSVSNVESANKQIQSSHIEANTVGKTTSLSSSDDGIDSYHLSEKSANTSWPLAQICQDDSGSKESKNLASTSDHEPDSAVSSTLTFTSNEDVNASSCCSISISSIQSSVTDNSEPSDHQTGEDSLVLIQVPGGSKSNETFGCGVVKGPDEWPGIFVQNVKSKSLAERLGLEPGDQIIRADNQLLSKLSFEESIGFIKRLQQDQDQLELQVRKGAALKHLARQRPVECQITKAENELSDPAPSTRSASGLDKSSQWRNSSEQTQQSSQELRHAPASNPRTETASASISHRDVESMARRSDYLSASSCNSISCRLTKTTQLPLDAKANRNGNPIDRCKQSQCKAATRNHSKMSSNSTPSSNVDITNVAVPSRHQLSRSFACSPQHQEQQVTRDSTGDFIGEADRFCGAPLERADENKNRNEANSPTARCTSNSLRPSEEACRFQCDQPSRAVESSCLFGVSSLNKTFGCSERQKLSGKVSVFAGDNSNVEVKRMQQQVNCEDHLVCQDTNCLANRRDLRSGANCNIRNTNYEQHVNSIESIDEREEIRIVSTNCKYHHNMKANSFKKNHFSAMKSSNFNQLADRRVKIPSQVSSLTISSQIPSQRRKLHQLNDNSMIATSMQQQRSQQLQRYTSMDNLKTEMSPQFQYPIRLEQQVNRRPAGEIHAIELCPYSKANCTPSGQRLYRRSSSVLGFNGLDARASCCATPIQIPTRRLTPNYPSQHYASGWCCAPKDSYVANATMHPNIGQTNRLVKARSMDKLSMSMSNLSHVYSALKMQPLAQNQSNKRTPATTKLTRLVQANHRLHRPLKLTCEPPMTAQCDYLTTPNPVRLSASGANSCRLRSARFVQRPTQVTCCSVRAASPVKILARRTASRLDKESSVCCTNESISCGLQISSRIEQDFSECTCCLDSCNSTAISSGDPQTNYQRRANGGRSKKYIVNECGATTDSSGYQSTASDRHNPQLIRLCSMATHRKAPLAPPPPPMVTSMMRLSGTNVESICGQRLDSSRQRVSTFLLSSPSSCQLTVKGSNGGLATSSDASPSCVSSSSYVSSSPELSANSSQISTDSSAPNSMDLMPSTAETPALHRLKSSEQPSRDQIKVPRPPPMPESDADFEKKVKTMLVLESTRKQATGKEDPNSPGEKQNRLCFVDELKLMSRRQKLETKDEAKRAPPTSDTPTESATLIKIINANKLALAGARKNKCNCQDQECAEKSNKSANCKLHESKRRSSCDFKGLAGDNEEKAEQVQKGAKLRDEHDNRRRQHELLMKEFKSAHSRMFGRRKQDENSHDKLTSGKSQEKDNMLTVGSPDDNNNNKIKLLTNNQLIPLTTAN